MKIPSNQHRITPATVLDDVRRFMPVIAYDPAYNPYALTDPIFESDGIKSNGLETDWNAVVEEAGVGGIWLNPVWNDPETWVRKMIEEAHKGGFKHDMLLWLPFYPETAAAKLIWQNATRICAWGKRVNHPCPPIDEAGNIILDGVLGESAGSMWPTWLSYFGPSHRGREFEECFNSCGTVLWGWNSQGAEIPAEVE